MWRNSLYISMSRSLFNCFGRVVTFSFCFCFEKETQERQFSPTSKKTKIQRQKVSPPSPTVLKMRGGSRIDATFAPSDLILVVSSFKTNNKVGLRRGIGIYIYCVKRTSCNLLDIKDFAKMESQGYDQILESVRPILSPPPEACYLKLQGNYPNNSFLFYITQF